ncbi:DUF6634 family protein [Roseomonas sp. WA12]
MIRIDGIPDLITCQDLGGEAARLERLAADLRRLTGGIMPTPEELEASPALHAWQLTTRPVPCLSGIGLGHPRLRQGPIVTTDVWVIDAGAGWARTLSRYYRLEAPALSQGPLGSEGE